MVEKRKLEAIQEAVERADGHADRQELAEAREILLRARADCERAGFESGFLLWRLCVVLDLMKEDELAFKHAEEALRQDPLATRGTANLCFSRSNASEVWCHWRLHRADSFTVLKPCMGGCRDPRIIEQEGVPSCS